MSIERGLVRKEDLQDLDPDAQSAPDDHNGPSERPALSPRLIEDLTAHKSAAIGAELMSQPDVALAAVVHCLALKSLYSSWRATSCLELSCGMFSLRRSLTAPDACKGFAAIEQKRERIADRQPGDPADLWQWCLDRSRDELLDLLATGTPSNILTSRLEQSLSLITLCLPSHAMDGFSSMSIDLHHAHVFASDISATIAWWCRHLGAKVLFDGNLAGSRNVLLGIGTGRLNIYDQAPANRDRGVVHHLGVKVTGLREEWQRLQMEGVVSRHGLREHDGWRYVMISAPDELLVELFEFDDPSAPANMTDRV